MRPDKHIFGPLAMLVPSNTPSEPPRCCIGRSVRALGRGIHTMRPLCLFFGIFTWRGPLQTRRGRRGGRSPLEETATNYSLRQAWMRGREHRGRCYAHRERRRDSANQVFEREAPRRRREDIATQNPAREESSSPAGRRHHPVRRPSSCGSHVGV